MWGRLWRPETIVRIEYFEILRLADKGIKLITINRRRTRRARIEFLNEKEPIFLTGLVALKTSTQLKIFGNYLKC